MKFLLLLTAAAGLQAFTLPRGVLQRKANSVSRRESTGITGEAVPIAKSTSSRYGDRTREYEY
jgi:hypothetical protein